MREGDLLWEPRGGSKLAAYMEERRFDDYHDLWRWSVEDLEGFWGSLWTRYGLGSYERVLASAEMPGAQWFPGARLNYAEYLLGQARPGETAIHHASESQPLAELSWDDLRDQVARCAAGLRRLGVGKGDRVAAYMPNTPETVVAFLATASLGANWSSCAPEFGTPTVIDRFAQIEPKLLIAIEGYRYGGKDFDRRPRVREIEAGIPSL
ncbi:MAG TPA: AMP-binding protein, partial [Thermoleophilaceae bacterium]|nr:AMP-binding protein [Thermoleophilaceae bacterium]